MTGRLAFVTAHGDHHKIAGVSVHQLKDLLPHHITQVDGLPITTPARTVVDLAAVVSFERLKRIVENGVLDRIVTDDEVGLVLRDVARRGKWGMKKLARVLAVRAPGEPVPDSVLERMLLDVVRSEGLPDPVPQFPHPGREIGTGWVDFAYPEAKLILEADGRRWHQRIAQMAFDVARDKAAARMGWLTMRFLHEELTADPADAGRSVRETLSHRTAA
jgi:very-short-patch-repair endonuclease